MYEIALEAHDELLYYMQHNVETQSTLWSQVNNQYATQ